MPSHLKARERAALSVTPVLLRLVLAVTFIWTGLGKIFADFEVSGQRAAHLAEMGVIKPEPRPAPTTPTRPQPETPPEQPEPAEPPEDPDDPALDDPNGPNDDPAGAGGRSAGSTPPALARTTASGTSNRQFTAADFPEPIRVARVYGVSLTIRDAAFPEGARADGSLKPSLWPQALAGGSWPRWLAYLVVAAELGFGLLVLIGLLTRLAAISLLGLMLGAIWLTTLAPHIQQGNVIFGFLPTHPAFSTDHWTVPLWQFALAMTALALFVSGPGALALDNAVFRGRHEPDDEDDDF